MHTPFVGLVTPSGSEPLMRLAPHTGERILEGAPLEAAFNAFSNSTGHVIAGIYACTPGRIVMAPYEVDELCFMIEGVLTIVDARGHEQTFQRGDFFVIPKGFSGVWHVREPIKKYYVIFNANGKAQERLQERGYFASSASGGPTAPKA